MESVLAQTYEDFRLVIADNASTDATPSMVAGFTDDRITYIRNQTNIGARQNYNLLLTEAHTELLLLLSDDDLLYPGHLARTVAVMDAYPSAGLVSTGFALVDPQGRVVLPDAHRFRLESDVQLETRKQFRTRGMRDHWLVHWSTALMRSVAAHAAGPLRAEDYPSDDFGLLLRLSEHWDVVHVRDVLGTFRIHDSTATAEHTAFVNGMYDLPDSFYERVTGIRLRSIDELALSERETRFLRRRARSSLDRALVENLAFEAARHTEPFFGLRRLRQMLGRNPRLMLVPRTWRLVFAELGGRRIKDRSSRGST